MRLWLFCSLGLAGCGSVAITPDPPRASEQPCVTSFGCPAGERCDEGKCQADVGCPGPIAPRVLGEHFGPYSYPLLVSVNAREYLLWLQSGLDASEPELKLLDLASGATSVLHHPPGATSCNADLRWCTVYAPDGTGTALTGFTLDTAGKVWSAATSHDLPAGYWPISDLSSDGEAILWGYGKPDLRTFNPFTGESAVLFDVDGQTPMRVITLPSGRVVTAYTHSSSGTTASFAPLVGGAQWTAILATPEVVKNYWIAVPAGTTWFLVGDFQPTGIPQSWSVSPSGAKNKASESDGALLFDVADRYSRGDPVLEGTVGKSVVCKDAACESARLDLATLERTHIGSVALPGADRSTVTQQRWLACDAVDAIIEEPLFPPGDPANATGSRLRAVRVLPDGVP